MIAGRKDEKVLLESKFASPKSEFVALYGRRRVGKTFLVRTLFKDKFTFHFTGLANVALAEQLDNFRRTLVEQHPTFKKETVESWADAFQLIKAVIEKSRQKKKLIFIDELPWLDTPNSSFIQALEHFWNSWVSGRNDVMLVVCGSAASWMINKLINNRGGLHNRVTQRIKVEPFTLKECEAFLKLRKNPMDRYQILQLYMVLGGIPFYWDAVEKGKSATQNIEKLCFSANGLLLYEFQNLFKSLFHKAERHEEIIKVLAKKAKGLTRDEIVQETKLSNGGGFTRLLTELEESGFIRKYQPFAKKSRNSLYQLIDFFSLFHLRFMQQHRNAEKNYWLKMIDSPKHRAWSGYAFEQVCLTHVDEIKNALGIAGVETQVSAWRSTSSADAAQIDLVIDRRDATINLCEMKFSINPFAVDKKYNNVLFAKRGIFKSETETRKSVLITMITTFGLLQNSYAANMDNDLDMNIFFE